MILDEIISKTWQTLEQEGLSSWDQAEATSLALQTATPPSFREALARPGISLIAEIKKASPSAGLIRPDFDPVSIARTYAKAGARAISCLTEQHYFLGSLQYLKLAVQASGLPVLRKDFIVHEKQIVEAREAGAAAVLLIMAALTPERLRQLQQTAARVGLEVLLEVHDEAELDLALATSPAIIGINNRNLKTMKIDFETTFCLREKIPPGILTVSESGIGNRAQVERLLSAGLDAILVGESLMRQKDIDAAVRALLPE